MDPTQPFLEDERAPLLLRLVPPLVHGVNNSLAVLGGAAESGGDAQEVTLARRELRRLGNTMRFLSLFSKPHAPNHEVFDLAAVAEVVQALVQPYAAARGVDLEFKSSTAPAVLSSDARRLEQLAVTFVAEQVEQVAQDHAGALADPDDLDPNPVARFAVRARGRRLALSFVRPAARDGSAPGGVLLERAVECAAELGMQVLVRTCGAATAVRFAFVGVPVAADQPPTQLNGAGEPERGAKRLLLVEQDPSLRELIASVLEEAGFRVRALGRTDGVESLFGADCDLLVLDADLEREHPGFLEELAAHPQGARRVLVLGEADACPPSGLHALTKPFRPQKLVEKVRALL